MFLTLALTLFAAMSIALPLALAEDSWDSKSPMPTGRFELGVVEANGKIYAIGGAGSLRIIEEYDPATDTWSKKADMPRGLSGCGAAEVNGKIYVIGRKYVHEYNTATDTWVTKADTIIYRNNLGVAEVNGKIYAIGGFTTDSVRKEINAVKEYNPTTDTWETKAPMPTARAYLGVAEVNGKIYAIGGRDSDNQIVNTVEEYDPATDTWETKSPMPTARFLLSAAVANGKIYAISGHNGNRRVNTVDEYDPATDTWETKASIPTARQQFGAAEVDGIIYAIGGIGTGDPHHTTVEAYTPPAPTTPNNPMNLTATASDAQVVLNWDAVTDATGYNVKRSTTSGGPYDSVVSAVYGTTYTDTGLTNGTTYYYVVSAIVGGTESANSNEAVATPQQSGGGGDDGRAVLWVTMDNGSDIDYDLSLNEINAFINWYKSKASGGVGDPFYTFDKSPISPYTSRTDYLVFDKIVCFKVNKY